jgi:hypothetical protein
MCIVYIVQASNMNLIKNPEVNWNRMFSKHVYVTSVMQLLLLLQNAT